MNESELEIIPILTESVRTIRPDVCIFCGQSLKGAASNEHVFPQWLQKELGIANLVVTPTHFESMKTDNILSQRQHTLDELVEGRVCATCNNGWMSDLEGQVQGTLTRLIRSERALLSLSAKEGLTLSRWALKTVCVLNSSSNYSSLIPAQHYSDVMQDVLPQGVAVYALQLQSVKTPYYWMQAPVWRAQGPMDVGVALARRSYKIAIRFDKLLLMVAYWPDPSWSQIRWHGIHFLLSASKGSAYKRELSDFPINDSSKAFGAFVGSLVIAENSTYAASDV